MSFRFAVGDKVRVLAGDPPGHIRTPSYIRGKTGVVEERWGEFRNPEELAFGKPGLPKRPLYLIRFNQAEVWPGYKGPAADTVSADIYEHWLEPAR